MWRKTQSDQAANLPAGFLPQLRGEPPDTFYVDKDGDKIYTNNPNDYPKPVTTGAGSNLFAETGPGGANPAKDKSGAELAVERLAKRLEDAGIIPAEN